MSGPTSVSTSGSTSDKVFAGSVPKVYEQYLVPLIFEPYARDLARRVAARPCERVLEIAAGTGAVTRQLASVLPQHVSIVATDLNPPMLDLAAAIGTMRPVDLPRFTSRKYSRRIAVTASTVSKSKSP